MPYQFDAKHISLEDLRKRIEATDLIPSRACLTDAIREKMIVLESVGITTLAALREGLKTPRRLDSLAVATGIDPEYLTLLRREIESYIPKPVALIDFDWLAKSEIEKLEQHEISDTADLYEMTTSPENRDALEKLSGIDGSTLGMLARLADLMRVQWVSPMFARMLIATGYDSAAKVAAANADELCESLSNVNAEERYFKGKIGLRDSKRLIQAAGYV